MDPAGSDRVPPAGSKPAISQWMKVPPGASGSRMTTTISLVALGSPATCSIGETSRPSHVCLREIVAPGLKSLVSAMVAPDPDPPNGDADADVDDDFPEPPPQPAALTATTTTARIAGAVRMAELSAEQSRDARTRRDPRA